MKRKKVIAFLCVISAVFILAGCQNKNIDSNGEPDQTTRVNELDSNEMTTENLVSQKVSKNIAQDYARLVETTTKEEDLYQFMNVNMPSATKQDADKMICGLIEYHGDITDVNYERLGGHLPYVSKGVHDFIILMTDYQVNPAIQEGKIAITLGDLLNRCTNFENFLLENKRSDIFPFAYTMYEKLLTAAVTGGYDKENRISNFYCVPNDTRIEDMAIDEYVNFASQQKDSNTADIIEDYVEVLNKNGKKVSDHVVKFYTNLSHEIKDEFDIRMK